VTTVPSDVVRLSGDAKRSYVRELFTAIAPRYDLLNHTLSLNIDRSWRRRAVERLRWSDRPDGTYLDLCAGTLDLAAELASRPGFRGRAVGADFVVPMLRLGVGKGDGLRAVGADALELPFPAGCFDGCTIGFGMRNLADLDAGLREIARVLKPGGRAVILELATPTAWPIRPLYLMYFRRVLPRIGRLVSKHTTAYSYLPASVGEFPTPTALADRLTAAGFSAVGYETMTFGVAAIHWGVRA
jgi:demethylmenaquinone methyltransferase/2-methoxy-6-polyprenyl-1,4-benzoquinol methylase